MENSNSEKNMLLYTSYWHDKDTFKMMPINLECPFVEAIYDPSTTLLVVIGKGTKQNFQYVPKLDEDGDPVRAKKPRNNGKAYREQRITMDVLHEYYLTDPEEQILFIERFAINAGDYNYGKFLRNMNEESKIIVTEKASLVGPDGAPLKTTKKKTNS